MKSMLWKELRENLKWGALALLALVAAEFYALASVRGANSFQAGDLTVVSSAFLFVTAFGCAAIGVALALVQILPELKRDQWAALLHRPVPRGTIFLGKVAAGLVLYLGATLFALLASIAYVVTPGQFAAPLLPGMLIPAFSDICLGAAFYCGTLLICLDRGPWWMRRAATAASLVLLLVIHITSGLPFLLPLAAAAIYLIAAWDAMLGNGDMQKRTRLGRLALIVIVLAGVETVVLALICLLRLLPQGMPTATLHYSEFVVSSKGEVLLEKQDSSSGIVLTKLDGTPLPPNAISKIGLMQPEYLCWFTDDNPNEGGSILASPRSMYTYLGMVNGFDYQSKEVWFLLIKQRYFIGYDKVSRRAIAICDQDGFKNPSATPNPFPVELKAAAMSFQNPHLYSVGTQLYSFDFIERTLAKIDTGGSRIYGAGSLRSDYTQEKPSFIIAATQNGIYLFDSDAKLISIFAYPHDPGIWSSLSMVTDESTQRLYLQSSGTPDFWAVLSAKKKPPVPSYLDVLDLKGNVLQTYSQPPAPQVISAVGWADGASVFLSPLLPAMAGKIFHHFYPSTTVVSIDPYSWSFNFPSPTLDPTGGQLAIILGLDLALGVVVLLCARRVGFSPARALTWALLVCCFGLPGLAAFRFASNWPTLVHCPQCGGLRKLQDEACLNCKETWPRPQLSGLEIFEMARR